MIKKLVLSYCCPFPIPIEQKKTAPLTERVPVDELISSQKHVPLALPAHAGRQRRLGASLGREAALGQGAAGQRTQHPVGGVERRVKLEEALRQVEDAGAAAPRRLVAGLPGQRVFLFVR